MLCLLARGIEVPKHTKKSDIRNPMKPWGRFTSDLLYVVIGDTFQFLCVFIAFRIPNSCFSKLPFYQGVFGYSEYRDGKQEDEEIQRFFFSHLKYGGNSI